MPRLRLHDPDKAAGITVEMLSWIKGILGARGDASRVLPRSNATPLERAGTSGQHFAGKAKEWAGLLPSKLNE